MVQLPRALVLSVCSLLALYGGVRETDAQGLSQVFLGDATFYQTAFYIYQEFPQLVQPALDKFMASTGMTRIDQNTVEVTAGGVTFNITGPAECDLCKGLANVIKLGDYNSLKNALITLCGSVLGPLGVNTDPLCAGLINLQGPHISEVLKDSRVTTASFCEHINSCFPSPVNSVPKKEKKKAKCDPQSGPKGGSQWDIRRRNALKLVQLTDIHVELEYAVGSSTDCGLPVCCITKYGPGNATGYGDYQCNIPTRTIEVFLEKVKTFSPDIVLFSGDVPPHRMWDETEQSQMACTEMLVKTLAKNLSSYTVYPVIGNHEMYPTNLYSTKHLNYTKSFIEKWISLWKPLAKFAGNTVQDSGSYSLLLTPGLRLVVFNSNYMYTLNFYNPLNDLAQAEADKMKKFVEKSLRDAKARHEKVILVEHHPPGNSDYGVSGSRWLEKVVLDYSDIIVLMPTGHTHIDEFRMIYDSDSQPRGIVYTAPSMTTAGRKNPSMRVYYLDRISYEVLDYDHYYLDLPAAIDYSLGKTTTWKPISLLYSAKSAYDLEDLSAKSWDDLLTRFETDNGLLLTHMAHGNANAGPDPSITGCDQGCTQGYCLKMKNINYDEYVASLQALANPPTS